MAAFRYEAVDGRGRPRQGLLDAATARQARDRLRADGLFPTSIEAAAAGGARAAFRAAWHARLLRLPVAGRLVTAIDTARFASTLAILVGSGTPLLRALDAARDVVWALARQQAER